MSCCGSQRASTRHELRASGRGESPSVSTSEPPAWLSGPVDFEYTGYGELTVTGPFSGVVYYFTADNRRVRVHGSDAPSMISVPGLNPVL
jgi:hypothetical protein